MMHKDMNPTVSAVITTHNRVDLVKKAIKSVLNQSCISLIEIIVVDDASDLPTRLALESLASEEGFQYIYITKDESRGGNHARNIGIKAARGKYVAFLDDDDEWMPEKIEKQLALMESNKECGVCHCGRIYDYDFGKHQQFKSLSNLVAGDLSTEIFTHVCCTTSTMMVEKNLLLDAGLFDEELKYWQEYELCMRLFQETKVAVVREHLVLYRVVQNDKNRLTNNIDGWEQAVEYINNKHSEKIKMLDSKDAKRRDVFYLRDGAKRSFRSGDFKRQKQYLWKLVRATHSPIDFVKAVYKIYFVDGYIKGKNLIKNMAKNVGGG